MAQFTRIKLFQRKDHAADVLGIRCGVEAMEAREYARIRYRHYPSPVARYRQWTCRLS